MATAIHPLSSTQYGPYPPPPVPASIQAAINNKTRPVSTPVPLAYHEGGGPSTRHHGSSSGHGSHSHSRKQQNFFGHYMLLQTLGEGEFGKVKLGVHAESGHEVAIKLIRKENVDTASRLNKVEREISVLRIVRHPNIVKLYDVIETDRYIGIVIEYASGGELFDHILAHRYLKEKDASRLFAQLISGVNYMHQKHIVHRDLKLENLLLDRNRNIIITDFGFANQFTSSKDDLMATSCGSPCYAAPELVISEGLYVGSAVDIWSCGVILYAMLCGYLPFDDDPANPDGDNINLLYKYILNTPLVFPEYVSAEARDLLKKMLVPDPTKRCDIKDIMEHRWLTAYAGIFNKTLQQLEAEASVPPNMTLSPAAAAAYAHATEQHNSSSKRHTISSDYEMGDGSTVNGDDSSFIDGYDNEESSYEGRHHDEYGNSSHSLLGPIADQDEAVVPDYISEVSQEYLDAMGGDSVPDLQSELAKATQSENLVDADEKMTDVVTDSEQDSFAVVPQVPDDNPSSSQVPDRSEPVHMTEEHADDEEKDVVMPLHNEASTGSVDQLEVPQAQYPGSRRSPNAASASRVRPVTVHGAAVAQVPTLSMLPPPAAPMPTTSVSSSAIYGGHRRDSLPSTFPSSFQTKNEKKVHKNVSSEQPKSQSVSQPSSPMHGPVVAGYPAASASSPVIPAEGSDQKQLDLLIATMQQNQGDPLETVSLVDEHDASSNVRVAPTAGSSKKSQTQRGERRKALSLLVGSSSSNDTQMNGTSKTVQFTSPKSKADKAPEKVRDRHVSSIQQQQQEIQMQSSKSQGIPGADHADKPKSTGKKVFDWFRKKTKESPKLPAYASTPLSPAPAPAPPTPKAASISTARNRQSKQTSAGALMDYNDSKLHIHHGPVDQSALTSRPPFEVFLEIKQTLLGMGIEVKRDGEYKLKCVRKKRKVKLGKDGHPAVIVETAPEMQLGLHHNGIISGGPFPGGWDPRKRKMSSGTPFRMLLRRSSASNQSSSSVNSLGHGQSSSAAANSEEELALSSGIIMSPSVSSQTSSTSPVPSSTVSAQRNSSSKPSATEALYGDPSIDPGDEIRFSVELCKIKNLTNLYIVDIRRMRGNLWGYKFLYHTLLERLDLSGKGGYIPTMASIANMQKERAAAAGNSGSSNTRANAITQNNPTGRGSVAVPGSGQWRG
ncbi:hypothetical protein BC936DRAFT_137367 [Jimgerdemannia flammicorona]|uniref:non-specific serine/threonine protein kinase n=2 Tax=Jimgerdemannia flammicorona TaxID=994334 RepID=A0A433CXH9_9FUNG|nr:hypothetical protein BC936DRAFT_137367 [Jimgerdemannia flammicorona]